MRQLITRIDDRLHARLRRRAESEGRSMNSIVTEAIESAVAEREDPNAHLRRRADQLGIELVGGYRPVSRAERERQNRERDAAVDATRGIGAILDDLIEEDRGPR
jgi:hypothetical protein